MVSHPDYGAVPPSNPGTGTVIISTPDATATYSSSGTLSVKPKTHSNVTVSGTGITSGSGMTYTTGTGVSPAWSAGNGTGSYLGTGKMKLIGEEADIEINGMSLTETLRALEQRLNILVPNSELEKEWDELKQLGDAYRKLERDLEEKSRMWQALQKTTK